MREKASAAFAKINVKIYMLYNIVTEHLVTLQC